MTHLTFVHDGRWEASLTAGVADPDAAEKDLAVRRALCAPRVASGRRSLPERAAAGVCRTSAG